MVVAAEVAMVAAAIVDVVAVVTVAAVEVSKDFCSLPLC
jgi:hypothetical protein